MKILEDVPIAKLTTMRLGGLARFVIEITTSDEVRQAFEFAKERNLPVWMMGSGANTIGHDEGFDGVIILNRLKGIFVHDGENLVEVSELNSDFDDEEIVLTAMGGEVWDDLVQVACDLGPCFCQYLKLYNQITAFL